MTPAGAADKLIVAKLLREARLCGFRVHKVERDNPLNEITVLVTVDGRPLTAVLREERLHSLSVGWV